MNSVTVPAPIYTLRPYSGAVNTVKHTRFSDSKAVLISGTSTGQLSLWDLYTKRQIWVEQCNASVLHTDIIHGSKLFSQCRNSTVDIWDIQKQSRECTFVIDDPGFCRVSFVKYLAEGSMLSPTSLTTNCFVVAHSDHSKVNVYDTLSQHVISTYSVKTPKSRGMCMCTAVHCSPSSGIVYVFGGFEDGSIIAWDARNNSQELSDASFFAEPVMCMDLNSCQEWGVCGSVLKELKTFSFCEDKGTVDKKYSIEIKNAGVSDVAIRSDSRILISGGWDGRVRVFGCKKGKPLAILNYHSATVHCIAFAGESASPDDKNLFVCGSKDERISLWRLY